MLNILLCIMIYKNYILKIHYSIFIAMAAQANASART